MWLMTVIDLAAWVLGPYMCIIAQCPNIVAEDMKTHFNAQMGFSYLILSVPNFC